MKIKIYQIHSERDTGRSKFMGLSKLKGDIDPSGYDKVFSGDVDCRNLEDVLARFNTEGHPLHRGHSLSVSDVVLTENGAFFCDTIGFNYHKVQTDTAAALPSSAPNGPNCPCVPLMLSCWMMMEKPAQLLRK